MHQDKVKVVGSVDFKLLDRHGNIVGRVQKDNLVVTTGLALLLSRLGGSGNALTHLGIGSGTNAAALGDTDLQTSIIRRVFDTPGGTLAGTSITFYCLFPAGVGTGTVSEAGLFNALSGGTMFSRIVFTPMTKSASMSLAASWTITALGA